MKVGDYEEAERDLQVRWQDGAGEGNRGSRRGKADWSGRQ